MSFCPLTKEDITRMILETATKLVSNDLMNEYKDARYQYQKQGIDGIFLDMDQAANDAGHLVVACYLEAENRELEMDALEDAKDNLDEEVSAEAEALQGEREAEIQYANSGIEAQPCASPKSSSKTSASTTASKPT